MMLVRRLKVSDLPRLEEIEAELAKDFPSRPGWKLTFRKLVEQVLEEEPEGLLIAEKNGVVAGWAAVRQRGTHPMSGLKDGHIFLPEGPGWGAEINEDVLRAHPWPGVGERARSFYGMSPEQMRARPAAS